MKYFEVTFTTSPCNEIVNDVVSALAGEIGFESFVEWDNGVQAYIQQQLFDEKALEEMVENFPLSDTSIYKGRNDNLFSRHQLLPCCIRYQTRNIH